MIKFYKDTPSTFECGVQIEGASAANSSARLILKFSNRTLMFESDLIGNKISIAVPKLYEIEDERGHASLEVIAENVYFKAHEFDFDLENKNQITVEDVSVDRTDPMVVTVEEIIVETPEVEEPKSEMFKTNCSPKNRKFVESALENEDESLDTSVLVFEDNVRSWAETVFEDVETREARYSMYILSQGIKEDEE